MGLGKKTIDDQNYCGKKVLVRCDFNVPMKDGVITNENRINAALPTIQKLVNDGAKVILCSHLGKPKNGPEAKFSLAPVAVALSAKLGKTVVFADDDNVVGENAKAAVAAAKATKAAELPHVFTGSVEHAIEEAQEVLKARSEMSREEQARFEASLTKQIMMLNFKRKHRTPGR